MAENFPDVPTNLRRKLRQIKMAAEDGPARGESQARTSPFQRNQNAFHPSEEVNETLMIWEVHGARAQPLVLGIVKHQADEVVMHYLRRQSEIACNSSRRSSRETTALLISSRS